VATSNSKLIGYALFISIVTGCGPASRRDFSGFPQRRITYEDMCSLQNFFDERNSSHGSIISATEAEDSTETQDTEPDENGTMRRAVLGEGTYTIRDRRVRRRLRQLLSEEYERIPELTIGGQESDRSVKLRVGWWASGQMRRLRPDQEITVTDERGNTVNLPFNPCVGEFLFGSNVYALRRQFFSADNARARGELPPESAVFDAAVVLEPQLGPDVMAVPIVAQADAGISLADSARSVTNQ